MSEFWTGFLAFCGCVALVALLLSLGYGMVYEAVLSALLEFDSQKKRQRDA
jgi:hypothetical protein